MDADFIFNKMKKFFVFIFLFNFFGIIISAQNQANIWYYGKFSGLDFNSGNPVVTFSNFYTTHGSAVESDSSGELLLYSDGQKLFNRDMNPMLNGDSLVGDDYACTQRVLIVKKPESNNIYYAFFVGRGDYTSSSKYGLWYDIIDMNGDNGLGEVIEKNIFVNSAWDAQDKLFALKQANNKDLWIITRKSIENKFAVFSLTKNGFNTTPVLSDATFLSHPQNTFGYLKVSYDKKYLFSNYDQSPPYFFEVGRFNDTTGEVSILYYLTKLDSLGRILQPFGIEFSPDSRWVYISFINRDKNIEIYQYDMSLVENQMQFDQSAVLINIGKGMGLQLARDGRIYCSGKVDFVLHTSVINKPWIRGTGCDYVEDAINMNGGEVYHCFPNILLDYLYRFEWEGECSGPSNAIRFKPNFMFPDSIHWNFGDPASGADSISYEISPVHYFSSGGEFEVSADVWYPPDSANPWGRYEHTSRVVTVKQSPQPHLGSDTLFCNGGSIELNGGAGQGSYLWSTGDFGMNDSIITVSDTGIYWVTVTAPNGCSTTDSIRLGIYPPAIFNTDSLVITPTSCGGTSGSITGPGCGRCAAPLL